MRLLNQEKSFDAIRNRTPVRHWARPRDHIPIVGQSEAIQETGVAEL